MSERPAFSIVIPAYNYAHYLAAAIDSALAQTELQLEVIVVDDGSTDETAAMVRARAECDARLHYLYQHNQGPAAARARGLAASRHPWLIFLDADDEMLPGALQSFAEAIQAGPEARVLVAAHLSAHRSAPQERARLVPPGPVGQRRERNFIAYLEKRIAMSNGACALHRSVFDGLDFKTDLRHTEDMPMFAHLLANHPAMAVAQPVLKVHHHPASRRHDMDAALAVGMELEAAIFDDNGLPDWARSYRRYYRARRAISLLKLADRHGRPDLVRHYFGVALRADWRQALHPRYLRRYVASLVSGKGEAR